MQSGTGIGFFVIMNLPLNIFYNIGVIKMIVLYIANIIVCFLLTWFASYYFTGPGLKENQSLSEWISYGIGSEGNLIFTLGLLIFILFLLDFPRKQLFISFKNLLSRKKVLLGQALILLFLLFDVYFYIFLKFGWFLIVPLSINFLLRGVFSKN